MEIYLDKQAVRTIRLSTSDAIEEGDVEALMEDIYDAFPEEQVDGLEQMLGGDDFMDVLAQVVAQWSGDDVDELFDLLETTLGDFGIDLRYFSEDNQSVDEGFTDEDYA